MYVHYCNNYVRGKGGERAGEAGGNDAVHRHAHAAAARQTQPDHDRKDQGLQQGVLEYHRKER